MIRATLSTTLRFADFGIPQPEGANVIRISDSPTLSVELIAHELQ